jgi:ComF family protein
MPLDSPRIISITKKIAKSFVDLLYPPLCLHCGHSLQKNLSMLCQECLALMTPLTPLERCPLCFSGEFDPTSQPCCSRCKTVPLPLDGLASVFDHAGPAATLVKQLKYGNKPWLAQGLAAYLAFQLAQLEWPAPDLIVPMPLSWLRRFDRGYNQSGMLADALSKLLSVPAANLLHRNCGNYSQARLNRTQRLQLDAHAFSLKKPVKLYGKTLLLIDDVATTGRSLSCCAEALVSAFPARLYGLTVCRAID